MLSRARRIAVDVTPLRISRDFRLMWTGQLISVAGSQMRAVALPYQVFALTHSSLMVGLLGLAQLFPLLALSLIGGVVADRVDRRFQLLGTQTGMAMISAVLAVSALAGAPPVWVVFLLGAASAGLSGLDQPARGATTPNLVPPGLLSSALALNFAMFSASTAVGPLLGGIVIARYGVGVAYAIDAITFVAAITAVVLLSPQPPRGVVHEPPLRAIAEGFRFARREGALMGGFVLDINAMVFGMPRALFPALALTLFHAGPAGVGLLYSAVGVGSAIGSVFSGFVGHMRNPGRAVVVAVILWGLSIVAFGLSTFSFVVAFVLMCVAAAADAISGVGRGTILQTIAPDNLRGRLSSVNYVVVVGGPYIGDIESGAAATLLNLRLAVITGGLLCLAGAALTAVLMPQLWRYERILEPAPVEVPDAAEPAGAPAEPPGG